MTETAKPVETVDMSQTWGEFGAVTIRLMVSGEKNALAVLKPDVARAFAAAQALDALTQSLTDAQKDVVSKTMVAELAKMGYQG